MSDTTSIYEQIGGEPAMQAAVEKFYRKLLRIPDAAQFFDKTDMQGQIQKQKAFLTMVTGGPVEYTGKNMRDGHKQLVERGLNDTHVDIVLDTLRETLEELNVPTELIDQIIATADSVRDDVLNR